MLIKLKKNLVVGVSVTPEKGLEVAQIDYNTQTILKYINKSVNFDIVRKEISDLDLFNQTLKDALEELQIPLGSEIVLSIPTVTFKVSDYTANLQGEYLKNVIHEELLELEIFKETEPSFSEVILPNSTLQMNKVAYIASSQVMLIEIATQIKNLGYKLIGVDSSVNSTLNALIYNTRVNTAPDFYWVMLLVENNCCRIIPMSGRNYVEYYEERISIGEVLGEEENYSTILNTVSPLLEKLPSQCLYVVSKTNTISAKKLADKLKYNGQIIHEESNFYTTEPFLELAEDLPEETKYISLDVIGAAIFRDFEKVSTARFNLYNEFLGSIFLDEQPVTITIKERKHKLTLENMINYTIYVAIPIVLILIIILAVMNNINTSKNKQIKDLEAQIDNINKSLEKHANISTEAFDEGDAIRLGMVDNKKIFTYYQIVGTEIPEKLWLTSLELDKNVVIRGQADNLESIYGFFRNIKDYDSKTSIKLQHLGLATQSKTISNSANYSTDSILSSMSADFYEFIIADKTVTANQNSSNKDSKSGKKGALEPLPDDLE